MGPIGGFTVFEIEGALAILAPFPVAFVLLLCVVERLQKVSHVQLASWVLFVFSSCAGGLGK